MGHQLSIEGAGDAVGREAWPEAYSQLRRLAQVNADLLTPQDWDALSDAAWWLCRVQESIEARARAYTGHVAAGADRAAGASAWMVFYEHHLAGRAATAAGWLARATRHLEEVPDGPERAYLALSQAFLAQERGDLGDALAAAKEMTLIAERCGSRDFRAMGQMCQGGVLMASGDTAAGMALVDEAMCAVLAGELSALFTGWIYCLALPPCIAAADLRRAGEWTEAAMAWCASLPAGTPFHGICRVHRVEVLHLRGAWVEASLEAGRACAELLDYDPQVAAEAFYLAGEIRRLRGDLEGAEEYFRRAHELGRDPQPGLALLRLGQGRAELAAAALRASLADEGIPPSYGLGCCPRRWRWRWPWVSSTWPVLPATSWRPSPPARAPPCSRPWPGLHAARCSSQPATRSPRCPSSAGRGRGGCSWDCRTRWRRPECCRRSEPGRGRRRRSLPGTRRGPGNL